MMHESNLEIISDLVNQNNYGHTDHKESQLCFPKYIRVSRRLIHSTKPSHGPSTISSTAKGTISAKKHVHCILVVAKLKSALNDTNSLYATNQFY